MEIMKPSLPRYDPASKQGIHEFNRTYVLVPADRAANNIINTLRQEPNITKTYEETFIMWKTVVNSHLNELPLKFSVGVRC